MRAKAGESALGRGCAATDKCVTTDKDGTVSVYDPPAAEPPHQLHAAAQRGRRAWQCLALITSWETTIAIVVLYVLIQQVENAVLVPRVSGSTLSIHPAILMIALVALSQFGVLWAILAGPIVALARDLFRYMYGRFDDPPRPAGVLPRTASEEDVTPVHDPSVVSVGGDAAR